MQPKKRHFILDLIDEGEHQHQDFKYRISDSAKIARSISAFANCSGGHLLVGVKDNGNIAGVSSEEEIYMVEQAAECYCKPAQAIACRTYRIGGKTVLKVDIAEAAEKPVLAPDEHGKWKAFYRVADENIPASNLHLKIWEHNNETTGTMVQFCDHERLLFEYLEEHGGITIEGYMKLAHISRMVAETSAVNLCQIHSLALEYHDGEYLLTLHK